MAGRRVRKDVCQDGAQVPFPHAELDLSVPITTRPARQRRAPVRYRGPDDNSDAESFDIHRDSPPPGASDSDDQATTRATDTAATLIVDTSQSVPSNTTATSQSGKSRNVAHDTRHFFRKEKERTVCLPCE